MVNYTKPTKKQKYRLKGNMKTRCYSEKYHEVKPEYKGCTVCEEWLNDKKSFYEWVDQNFYKIEGEETVQLDKDILVPGNKVYSPETCIFAPKAINDLFVRIHKKKKNGLPVGVTYCKSKQKYRVSMSKTCDKDKKKTKDEGKSKKKIVILGYYDTITEAYEVYKKHKMAEIIYIADMYKDKIPEKLYQAMINWKFDEI